MRTSLFLAVLVVAGCSQKPDPYKFPPDFECVKDGFSTTLAPAGALADADYWTCNPPSPGSGDPGFTGYDGWTTVVNGGTASLLLHGDVPDDATMYVGIYGEAGYYVTTVPTGDNPRVFDLSVSPTVPFDNFTAWIGVDTGSGTPDAPSIGRVVDIPFDVIKVGTGDIQVNVNWDTFTDVDLYVVDPEGSEIYYGALTSPSGGILDLDSNAACSPGPQNENIFWPTDGAPPGRYEVRVNYWSACTEQGTTNFRTTALAGGEVMYTGAHTFSLPDEYPGGAGAGTFITEFWWDGEVGTPTGSTPDFDDCDPITIDFTGLIKTISGTPFGMSSTTDLDTPISGSFSYAPCVRDSNPESAALGEYDHLGTEPLHIAVPNRFDITGSGRPLVTIEGSNTFRWRDGPQLSDGEPPFRIVSVDGVEDVDVDVHIAISSSTAVFSNDTLPLTFPMTTDMPHTFALNDPDGTLLVQWTAGTLQQR